MKLAIDWTFWGSLMTLIVNGVPKMTTPFSTTRANSTIAPVQVHAALGHTKRIVARECQSINSEEFLS